MKAKELPKIVYVCVEEANSEDWFLTAEPTAELLALNGEKRLVGLYELKEKLIVSLKVQTELVVKKA